MAFVVAAGAIGAGVSALWFYFRSRSNVEPQDASGLTEQEIQNIVDHRGEELHSALVKVFGPSNSMSRQLSTELALLLRRTGFECSFSELKRCVASELSTCEQSRIFFRSNTFSTRLVMDIIRQYGQIYIEHLTAPMERYLAIITPEEALKYEVMTFKIENMELTGQTVEERAAEAQVKFLALCDIFLDSICTTPVPMYIKYLLREIEQQALAKWAPSGNTESIENELFDTVGGVLVLRFIIPALANQTRSVRALQMVVIRASQVIQSLSNSLLFSREPDMFFVNQWMTQKIPIIKQWKQSVLESAPTNFEEAFASIPSFDDSKTTLNYRILSECFTSAGIFANQTTSPEAAPSQSKP
jgi:hypothetical protein